MQLIVDYQEWCNFSGDPRIFLPTFFASATPAAFKINFLLLLGFKTNINPGTYVKLFVSANP